MLLLLFNQRGGPVFTRAPSGSGYTRAVQPSSRPTLQTTARTAQPNTKRP